MDHFYQNLDRAGGFDYQLQSLPELGDRIYRGPQVDLSRPFIAFVGAAQTFGRFVEAPFPAILSQRLGMPALNLGVGGAGPRHFLAPRYLALLNKAEAVVLQVLSGRSASNSMFNNSAGGGLVGESPLGSAPMRAEEFLARAAQNSSRSEFAALIEEMRADYVASYLSLFDAVTAPKILLWLSKRKPAYEEDYENLPQGVLGEFPHLVNERVVAEIAARCEAYVECVSSEGLPQKLWRSSHPIDGAALRGEMLVNRYYPSPQMHAEAADLLEAPCRALLGRYPRAEQEGPRRFIVTGPERTGTNLLVGLLNQYSGCYCGGELFNSGIIARGGLPWVDMPEPERARLVALRLENPLAFLAEVQSAAEAQGHTAVGLKLLYAHGLGQPTVLEALAADKTVKVIHVTRRNLLRRLVSERQARTLGKWSVGRGAAAVEMPKVAIELADLARSLALTRQRQATFEQTFAGHQVLHIVYEDLAARPAHVAARAAEFLGLPPLQKPPIITLRKTGSEDLSQVLEGYAELRANLRQWASFFDS